MSVSSLAEEISRRQSEAGMGGKKVDLSKKGEAGDVLFLVTRDILKEYADVVQAVGTGAKEPAVLERLADSIITERGYTPGDGYRGTIKNVLDHLLRYGPL